MSVWNTVFRVIFISRILTRAGLHISIFFLVARAEKFFRRAPYFATVDSNLEM